MTTMPDDVAKPMTAAPATDRMARRKRLLSIFFLLLAAAAIGFGLWDWLVGSNYASTDNAYVGGDMAQITPQVNAAVARVEVGDADAVKAGDVLAVLDDADARIARAKAAATLAGTIRRVEQIFATSRALAGDIVTREAAIRHAEATLAQARSALDKATIDLRRREELQSSGAVSAEELTIARNAFAAAQAALNAASADLDQAKAALQAAQAQKDANDALINGTGVADNPDVLAAKSALDQAELDLARTVLRAPFAGVVAQRHVQVGQRVKIGDVLMAVVPVGQLYVDANFKENQLSKVRPGQKVELTSDLYGGKFIFHGTVAGFAGGTGAAMAIIPAQNATGNWIKVVQRLPVRVTLDPAELAGHPLRIGLSMDVTVDLRSGR
jgi:membrane fusion protein (multidrug efflux system)